MNYYEYREQTRKEVDDFVKENMFFAFNKDQFEEGMKSLGLDTTEESLSKMSRLACGGFILKDKLDAYKWLVKSQEKTLKDLIEDDRKNDTGFTYGMFEFELCNHEYGYTGEVDQTLASLGMTEEQVNEDDFLYKNLAQAMKKVWSEQE